MDGESAQLTQHSLSDADSLSSLLKALWQAPSSSRESLDVHPKAVIPICDSILFQDGCPFRWLFTSEKTGEVLKKRSNRPMNPSSIVSAFKKKSPVPSSSSRPLSQRSRGPQRLAAPTMRSAISIVWFLSADGSLNARSADELELEVILKAQPPELILVQANPLTAQTKLFEHTVEVPVHHPSNGESLCVMLETLCRPVSTQELCDDKQKALEAFLSPDSSAVKNSAINARDSAIVASIGIDLARLFVSRHLAMAEPASQLLGFTVLVALSPSLKPMVLGIKRLQVNGSAKMWNTLRTELNYLKGYFPAPPAIEIVGNLLNGKPILTKPEKAIQLPMSAEPSSSVRRRLISALSTFRPPGSNSRNNELPLNASTAALCQGSYCSFGAKGKGSIGDSSEHAPATDVSMPLKLILLARAETAFIGAYLDYDTDGLWLARLRDESELHAVLKYYSARHMRAVVSACAVRGGSEGVAAREGGWGVPRKPSPSRSDAVGNAYRSQVVAPALASCHPSKLTPPVPLCKMCARVYDLLNDARQHLMLGAITEPEPRVLRTPGHQTRKIFSSRKHENQSPHERKPEFIGPGARERMDIFSSDLPRYMSGGRPRSAEAPTALTRPSVKPTVSLKMVPSSSPSRPMPSALVLSENRTTSTQEVEMLQTSFGEYYANAPILPLLGKNRARRIAQINISVDENASGRSYGNSLGSDELNQRYYDNAFDASVENSYSEDTSSRSAGDESDQSHVHEIDVSSKGDSVEEDSVALRRCAASDRSCFSEAKGESDEVDEDTGS